MWLELAKGVIAFGLASVVGLLILVLLREVISAILLAGFAGTVAALYLAKKNTKPPHRRHDGL